MELCCRRQREQKKPNFPEMLDTGASLCCSVRQRRLQIQALGAPGRPVVVTIREVAKESGFSSTTVSIVLNNAPLARYIPDTTKKRIERAAKKLGYRPNLFARSLRNQRTHTVGVMVFDMTDPYCTPILRGIENTLYQASFLPILTDVHNERSRFERYLEMLLDRRVEALIVVANWLFVEIDVLADLEKANLPTAMIGRELEAGAISSVIVDNELGAQVAIEHLFSLGHRQIAFIRGPKRITDTAPRWKGVRSFAKTHNLEIDPGLVVDLPESSDPISSFEAGYKLTEDLIRKKHPFTALMAFDDMTALGAIRALSKAGIRVPEQCSVIGFDDVAHSSLLTPSLTTVRQPMAEMGKTAVSIVSQGITAVQEKHKIVAQHRKLLPELVIRDSTSKPK
jgi:LacI family transcriptional regulator